MAERITTGYKRLFEVRILHLSAKKHRQPGFGEPCPTATYLYRECRQQTKTIGRNGQSGFRKQQPC
ncbi:MAG: hypothetical protein KUL83_09750 [Lentimicrobium sp.]|nr:hypothetical protein [Lentimicrobium sp.]